MSRYGVLVRQFGAIACLSALAMLVGCGVISQVKAVKFGYHHEREIRRAIADFLAVHPAFAWIQTGKVSDQADRQLLEASGLLKKYTIPGERRPGYVGLLLTRRARKLAKRDHWYRWALAGGSMWTVNVGSLTLTAISTLAPVLRARVLDRQHPTCFRVEFESRFQLNRSGRDLAPIYPSTERLHLSRGPVEFVEIFQLDFRPRLSDARKVITGHLIVCTHYNRWFVHLMGK